MAFFQKIADDTFQSEADFVVKESKKMRLFIGILLLTFSLFIFQGSAVAGLAVALIGIASLLVGRREQVIMVINKQGFFYYGSLLTDWSHFVSAEFIEEAPVFSSSSAGLSDRFYLSINYYKKDKPGCFGRKIPLTNTQDKSEEEILATVRFYYRNWSMESH